MVSVKSVDSLIRYLREQHQINISGSIQERELRNIGYYHGYKGYRFIYRPSNKIPYTDFNQIIAVNTLDMELKTLFYPQIMSVETALKNYVLEIILAQGKVESFDIIYDKLLTNYQSEQLGSLNYKKALNKRLGLRNKVYSTLAREYSSDKQVVQHFYHNDKHVPIWAIFEVISLGEFGNFVLCANNNVKRELSMSLNLNQAFDSDAKMAQNIIFLIKDLRNAVAHNDVIFDNRFTRGEPKKSLRKALENDTYVNGITFKTITDYLVLLVFIQKQMEVPKTELNRIVSEFEASLNNFRGQVPPNVYSKIFYTDTKNKITGLKSFIES